MLTFTIPLLPEIYWFFKIWNATGHFINYYSVWVLTLLVFLLMGGGCLLLAAKLEDREKRA